MTKTSGNFTDFVDFSRASSGTALRRIAYGSELITNGTFDSDYTGWTAYGNITDVPTLTIVSGELEVAATSESSNQGITTQLSGLSTGDICQITFDLTAEVGTGLTYVRLASTATLSGTDIFPEASLNAGTHTTTFVVDNDTPYLGLFTYQSGGAARGFTIDNVTVKKVTLDDSSGDLVLFNHPDDIPRVEYDTSGNVKGLLVEEARTNLIPYSEDFTNADWDKVTATVTTNAATAPDGTSTADKVTLTSASTSYVREFLTISNAIHSFSIFAKAGTTSSIQLYVIEQGVVSGTADIDLSDGTVSNVNGAFTDGVTATSFVDGWYRITGKRTFTASATNHGFGVAATGQNGLDFYIWGAQLEAGSFATSYIPTSGSTAARSVDIASIDVDQFGYNKTAGTMLVEYNYVALDSGVLGRFLELNGTSASTERILLYQAEGSENTYFQIRDDGVTSVGLSTPDFTFDQDAKVAASYSSKSAILYSDGDLSGADTSVVVPDDITKLDIGRADSSGTDLGKVYIKSVKYYPRRLTNAQLEKLTKPAASTTLSLTFDGQDGSSLTTGLHP